MSQMLYYDSKRKSLVKGDNRAIGPYIQEHDEKGEKTLLAKQELEIPENNVKIVVKTNLHYGSKSYMNATISMADKTIFNFLDTSLSHSVYIVHANPGDWDNLFDRIINLYNSVYNSETHINKYFDNIKEILEDSTGVDKNKEIQSIRRLAEIVKKLPESIFFDNITIDKRIQEVCTSLFKKIITEKVKTTWDRQEIESDLHDIFFYLSNRDEVLTVLEGINVQLKD